MRKWIAAALALLMLLLVGCAPQAAPDVPAEDAAETVTPTPSEDVTPDDIPEQTGEFTEPEEEFLSAQYLKELPDNVTYITADDRGELVLLETTKELTNLWISRVIFDEEQKDYIRTERVWWQSKWEPGSKLVLGMAITKEYPAMELSWEDEFGQRERRLIEFKRVFSGGTKTETVSLLYFISPLQPTDLTAFDEYYYDLNADGSKEIIRFTMPDKTAGEKLMAALKITEGSTVFEYHVLLQSDCRCYLADLNGDYRGEVYLSGKAEDGTLLTYALQLSELGIVPVPLAEQVAQTDADDNPVLLGGIEKMETHVLYLSDTVTLFSHPYTAHCSFGYYGGALEPISGVWTIDAGKAAEVTLGVPVAPENGGEKTLSIGTKLQPVESDLHTFIKIQTTDGEVGTIFFTTSKAGERIIGGHPEHELLK